MAIASRTVMKEMLGQDGRSKGELSGGIRSGGFVEDGTCAGS